MTSFASENLKTNHNKHDRIQTQKQEKLTFTNYWRLKLNFSPALHLISVLLLTQSTKDAVVAAQDSVCNRKNGACYTLNIQLNGQDTCWWNVVQFLGEFLCSCFLIGGGKEKNKTKQTTSSEWEPVGPKIERKDRHTDFWEAYLCVNVSARPCLSIFSVCLFVYRTLGARRPLHLQLLASPCRLLSMDLKAFQCISKYLWIQTQLFCFSNWVPAVNAAENQPIESHLQTRA